MTDLDKLIAAVEAGEWKAGGDESDTWLLIFDSGLRPFHGHIYEAWHGSLDAAKRLHDALLPGWDYCIDYVQRVKPLVYVQDDGGPTQDGEADNPARAWLLAILRAIKAKGA